MKDRHSTPCRAWARVLGAAAGDLAPSTRAALEQHLISCAACASARAAYQRIDRQLRGLPAPAPLPDLPPQLARLWLVEDTQRTAPSASQYAAFNGRHGAPLAQRTGPAASFNRTHQGQDHVYEGMRTMRTSPSLPSQPSTPPRRSRRSAGWISASIAVALVLLFTLAFLVLPGGGTRLGAGQHPGSTSTNGRPPTPTVLPLTARSIAYLGLDGHLHDVTLAGAHDTTGPVLPKIDWLTQADNGRHAVAAAPDGSAFAYIQASSPNGAHAAIAIVNAATNASINAAVPAANLWWSPNSSQLAADAYGAPAMGPVWIVNSTTGQVRQISATLAGQRTDVFRIAGWLDATHLAVLANRKSATAMAPPRSSDQFLAVPASGGPAIALDVLDISTGTLRHLVDLMAPPDVFVAPDGTAIFVASSSWVATAYVVDPATGATRDLPHISATFTGRFVNIGNADFAEGGNWATAMAWMPGTHTVAMSLAAWGPGVEGATAVATQPAGVWLLDLDHDRATSITRDSYPLAFPSDETPTAQELLVSSLPSSSVTFAGRGTGPALSEMLPLVPRAPALVLTRSMALFIGQVRAAG